MTPAASSFQRLDWEALDPLLSADARRACAALGLTCTDAEDVGQDAACDLYRRLPASAPRPLHGDDAAGWRFRYVFLRALRLRRRRARAHRAPPPQQQGAFPRATAEAPPPSRLLPTTPALREIHAELLPEELRAVVVLIAHGASRPEAARILGTPDLLVRARAVRALVALEHLAHPRPCTAESLRSAESLARLPADQRRALAPDLAQAGWRRVELAEVLHLDPASVKKSLQRARCRAQGP